MVMSQGTYTFLACFAGFWLVWAVIVMLCCFCSFLQRRLKRHHEERLREQCLRTVEMEPLGCPPTGYPPPPPPPPPLSPPPPSLQLPREPPQFCGPETLSPPLPLQVPHPMPQANWVSIPDTDIFGKPPCYEEAVLMEDPPPPYSEVLADLRGGTYLKPAPLRAAPAAPPPLREHQDPAPVFTSETSKPPVRSVFPDRGYSSLIRLPSSQRWDSLGHLLYNMDLNHNNLSPLGARPIQAATAMATMPRREPRIHHEGLGLRGGTQGLQGSIQGLQGGTQGLHGGIQGLQGSIQGLQGGTQGLNGGTQGLHGGIQGLQGSIQGLQGSIQGLQGSVQGLSGGIQGLSGGIQGLRGGIQGFQGGFQGLQGVHGLRGLEPSCGLPTAFPLLGRSTAV